MMAEQPSGTSKRELWNKHAWLCLAVEKRNQLLAQPRNPDDPMLLFSNVLAKCLRMYLSCIRPCGGEGATDQEQEELGAIELDNERAMQSLNDLVQLVKTLPKFSCFKVCFHHPSHNSGSCPGTNPR